MNTPEDTTLILNARVIDPHSGHDNIADMAIQHGRITHLGALPQGMLSATPVDHILDAQGLWLIPGLVDLCVRVKEPGLEHEGMLASELMAAVAGGVTSMVCPPDTDPVLDEPGLVEMLRHRADQLRLAQLYPLGALTKGLKGEVLTEMGALTQAGCVGFGQAEMPLSDTHVLQRALSYASTFGYSVHLHPQDPYLSRGVAASGPLALRMGLSSVPVASETIAIETLLALMRGSRARVHLSRLSSAQGVELVRRAKAEGLPLTCDVSMNSLHLSEVDMGYFDARARLIPPLRQARDRDALREALASGVIDALVSDHNPVAGDMKVLPFAQAEPGASGVEMLLSLTLKWILEMNLNVVDGLRVVTSSPGEILSQGLALAKHPSTFTQSPLEHTRGALTPSSSSSLALGPGSEAPPPPISLGRLGLGAWADFTLLDPHEVWSVSPNALISQGKHTPFDFEMNGSAMTGRVKSTWVKGRRVFNRD
jgi:dihydroorotase